MKGPQSFAQLLSVTAALSPLAAAWPSWLPHLDALIVRRDDNSTSQTSTTVDVASTTTGATATGTTGSVFVTTSGGSTITITSGQSLKTTNLNTAKPSTGTATAKVSGTSKSAAATHTTFNVADQPGGVSMISPATTAAGTQLYKIGGTPITWVWNYTSLQGTPTGIDVFVSCSVATETWTLTQNMSFAPTATFTWDTGAYQQSAVASPLLTQQYTLVIIDADSTITGAAEAGYLSAYNGFQFGMYTPQPYSNLSEWKCATCNAGNGNMDRQATGFMLTMCLVTVFSFTWFVTGFGTFL